MNSFDAVIIGSGISSLTSAILLAKKGKSVCVLEQYNKPGGYMHCFNRFGQRFDTGAHYVGAVGPGQPFRVLLDYLDVYDDDLFTKLDPEGFDIFRCPDFEFSIPVGYEKAVTQLGGIFPREKEAIRSYFNIIADVAKNFPTYQFGLDVDMNKALEAMSTPLSNVVTGLTSNPKLQFALYSYCTLHGVEPEDVSLGMHAIVTDSLLQGAYGLKHGGDALTKKFIQKIESLGGRVLTKKRVERIVTREGMATGVRTTDGEEFLGHWVISGIHPKLTLNLVDDPQVFSPIFRDRVSNLQETLGLFGIYAKRNSPNDIRPDKNYYFFSTSDPAKMLKPKDPGEEPFSIFMSPASRNVGPNEPVHVNIHAAGPIKWFEQWQGSQWARRPEDYEVFKQNYAEKVFDLIGRYIPGFRSSIDKFATSSPLTNIYFNGTPEGSPYGLYHSIQNTGARALGPRTKIPNLLLTGQNCLFPGLLAGAITGLRTSAHIIGMKPIIREVRQSQEMSL